MALNDIPTELLENILLENGPEEVLSSQRINKYWQTVICNSPQLQWHHFRQPRRRNNDVVLSEYKDWEKTNLGGMHQSGAINRVVRLNPMLMRSASRWTDLSADKLGDPHTGSWYDMYLTQPPTKQLRLFVGIFLLKPLATDRILRTYLTWQAIDVQSAQGSTAGAIRDILITRFPLATGFEIQSITCLDAAILNDITPGPLYANTIRPPQRTCSSRPVASTLTHSELEHPLPLAQHPLASD